MTQVFEQDGRAVPVFNDKHLSFSFAKAKEMVEIARSGSSSPFWPARRCRSPGGCPPIELPLGCVIDDALMVGVGSSDAMDFHALEAMQCMVERRRGGETGVKAVQLIAGDSVWKAGEQGRWSRELLEAALSRSDSLQGLTVVDGRTQNLARQAASSGGWLAHPAAYFIEYADGTRATLLMLNGAVGDYTFAARVRGLPSDRLDPVPPATRPERRLLGLPDAQSRGDDRNRPGPLPGRADPARQWDAGELSRFESAGHRRLDTPHLDVRYQPPPTSQFCQT